MQQQEDTAYQYEDTARQQLDVQVVGRQQQDARCRQVDAQLDVQVVARQQLDARCRQARCIARCIGSSQIAARCSQATYYLYLLPIHRQQVDSCQMQVDYLATTYTPSYASSLPTSSIYLLPVHTYIQHLSNYYLCTGSRQMLDVGKQIRSQMYRQQLGSQTAIASRLLSHLDCYRIQTAIASRLLSHLALQLLPTCTHDNMRTTRTHMRLCTHTHTHTDRSSASIAAISSGTYVCVFLTLLVRYQEDT